MECSQSEENSRKRKSVPVSNAKPKMHIKNMDNHKVVPDTQIDDNIIEDTQVRLSSSTATENRTNGNVLNKNSKPI